MLQSDDAVRRAYGVLATSLNEALIETRHALEPHAALLPKGRLGEFDGLLAEFARRRVKIAVYGEVKAGKSTLINALAGKELSPVAFDPLTSVPLRITYGTRTIWQVGANRVDTLGELTQIMRAGVRDVAEVVVETEADLLQLGGQVDLVDTPGVGSDERFDAISAEALRALDAVVLVVRYPSLFTQATRRLMEGLQADIGKLFVVWNLDADCAELEKDELARHAETLRADVAGAHELYLVDARAAFRAQQAGGRDATAGTGLDEFSDALGRFASSDKRELVALREAGKRAVRWIDEAGAALGQRRTALDGRLGEVRERLNAVQRDAEAKTAAERARVSEFQTAVDAAGQERGAAVTKAAAALQGALRTARRAWMRSGKGEALAAAVNAAAEAFAAATASANGAAVEALRAAAKQYGAVASPAGADRVDVRPGAMAPPERLDRARSGNLAMLRRALWRRWYLPGLAALEKTGIAEAQAVQSAWFESATKSADTAVRGVLEGRLADIARASQGEQERIRVETNFLAEEGEQQALAAHAPVLTNAKQRIEDVSKEARRVVA
ncbi:MAG TPA: dynamin family protein [Candidatus Dormibacteraeota bacterium]|nr:dynamin family protein [Candidatus Dormibacteraeota bacterium]